MREKFVQGWFCILAATFFLTGCHRQNAAGQAPSGKAPAGAYFQTHFQDESQFIVETTVADLAEQIYFAQFHKSPDQGVFDVSANETPGSQFGAPVYQVQINLDAQHRGLQTNLNITGPIWSPETYAPVVALLAQAVKLAPAAAPGSDDTALLAKLTDGEAATIESENQSVSHALENDFANPQLHEQAALLLGAFMMREHSGDFFEIRTPLCRMASHLALARHLEGGELSSVNGQVAVAMLLTLMNNEADALVKLGSIKTNGAALTSWVRALQARNSSDYRPLDKSSGLSPVETSEWFYALNRAANSEIAWSRLSEAQKQSVAFNRIINQCGSSVEIGHQLMETAMAVEFREISDIYKLARQKQISQRTLVAALNELPGRCIHAGTGDKVEVQVIDWGLWAGFLQRHLCHAAESDFNMLQRKWGVPEDAAKFAKELDNQLGGLRLYPFLRRFNSVDVASYHKSVDDGFKVTVATPQFVAPQCWNYLCYQLNPGEYYMPIPNPHVNEWHKLNPPPGTAYDLPARFNHPSLTGRGDADMWLDKLHARAPYDWSLNYYLLRNRYKEAPTYAQASQLFGDAAAYDTRTMTWLAEAQKDKPDQYEFFMARAAAVNPSYYFSLANYFVKRGEDDKAAGYHEKGNKLVLDSVEISNNSLWLLHYYLKKGRLEDARKLADFGADVYSSDGLQAKAEYLEAIKDYAGAHEWFAKNEERYNDSGPLVAFCLRYEAATGDKRYSRDIRRQSSVIFPKGTESVTLASFSGQPQDGVSFLEENQVLRLAGMKAGDVIVAVDGIRVHNQAQYEFQRDQNTNPEMTLIVWQGNAYHEYKASPPGHRFGVEISTYQPK